MFLKILLISVVILALAFAGIAIKMFVKKDGEFKKSCSSVHPKTGERLGCACGGGGEGDCDNKKSGDSKINIQPLQLD